MKIVKMHDAKTRLSSLVRDLAEGREREIIIAVGDRPAARLVPYKTAPRRELGPDEGLINISPEFDDVNREIARLFNGD